MNIYFSIQVCFNDFCRLVIIINYFLHCYFFTASRTRRSSFINSSLVLCITMRGLDTSMFMIGALAFGIIAFGFDLVGISLPGWVQSRYLWKSCSAGGCTFISFKDLPSDIKAGLAFNVLGFLAGGAAVLVIILYIFCLRNNNIVRVVGMITAFVAAGLIMVGVIIIGTSDEVKRGAKVGTPMILAIIGAVCYIVTGVLVALHYER
ncbi:hypothetical protein LOTGIDRAFT_232446 [Lottia gigantea]|uniref:Uncharacterized protein n=1 Tax=Lottia gigantea TaxID=225164 RepID=V4AKT1_LOTGI|nr:hypothetical protein LOTGIDRAFT_232446 [Lottia gigantea]ESO94186.1 hypothetical protein LOTGIDRAFT_232446 [Lottia gigantea]